MQTLDKKTLRQTVRHRIRQLAATDRQRQMEAIHKKLLSLPELAQANIVLAYAGMADELDTQPLLHALLTDRKTLLLPKVREKRQMTLHHVVDLEKDLCVAGVYAIREPTATCPCMTDDTRLDVVIVPGVAFTRAGHRLGRGGGYYDRFFAESTDVCKIAAVFTERLVDTLPLETHDQPIDIIVTPTEIIRCR